MGCYNGGKMKKFIVYLLVIICTVSLGFAVFYLVRDNEIISISSASMYKDVGDTFTLDVNHINKKASTDISITSSDDSIVSGRYNKDNGTYTAEAKKGGVARINVRTTNAKFRNLWCDVIVGDGTIESPFYISTAKQLASIGMGAQYTITGEGGETQAVEGVFAGAPGYERYLSNACYKLVANIDASEVNGGYWVPLRHFTGRFDGNGLTISNIYINATKYQDEVENPDTYFVPNIRNAGLFESVGKNSVVYNLKLKNFIASGNYINFGTVAAENYGTIERVEVEDAYLSIKTAVFGGIVGVNYTDKVQIESVDSNGNPIAKWERSIARVDRCSIKMTLGQEERSDGTISLVNISGQIGGIVGTNHGGTVVYSYARGNAYVGANAITYGGVVAENIALKGMPFDSATYKDETEYQGANIKDCYSDIRLTLSTDTPLATSTIAGAVGVNSDYKNGLYENLDHKVNSYLIGIYYNKDNLNFEQEGITKNFKGVASFKLGDSSDSFSDVSFGDTKTIVWGLSAEEMTSGSNFISHTTKSVEFNEDGTSKGIVEKNVLWLFDTVWAIDSDHNDGMPYLNYQLVYIPDDFATVGVPIVSKDLDKYYYKLEVNYPVSILSGEDGKLRIRVNEYYQLKYSPTGIEMDWSSSDENIVEVDPKTGKLYGKKAGVATVTVKTKTSSDTITVIVENIPYIISNLPSTIYMYVNEEFDLGEITITPAISNGDEIVYSLLNDSGNASDIAHIVNKKLIADKVGNAELTIKIADTVVTAKVIVSADRDITLSASPRTISGFIEEMNTTETITITNDQSRSDIEYTYEFKDGSDVGIVSISQGSANNKFNYTINGTGTAILTIKTNTVGTKGSIDIYFYIKTVTNVQLSLSSATITGYYGQVVKTGSVTISNSANVNLSYKAESSKSNVVEVDMVGNSMNYTIKGVGTAVATIEVTTAHYAGAACVTFNILQDPDTGTIGGQVGDVDFVDLNYSSFTIYVGDTLSLKASGNFSTVSWTSGNSSVASVSNKGVVTGKSKGTTTITATTNNGATATCAVVVKAKPSSTSAYISLSPSTVTLNEGSTRQLTYSGNGYSKVEWKSSNTSVATVSNGVINAIKAGSCTITIYGKEGNTVKASATCSVTVTAVPVTISLDVNPATTVNKGTQVRVNAIVNKNVTVTWSTKPSGSTVNGNTLTVNTSSLSGTYSVKATYGNTSATATFTVQDPNAYSKYITTYAQLNAIRYHLNKDFILAADINADTDWTPIGTCSSPFTGSFSNNGNYTISGLNATSGDHSGLFGCIKGATINGINVADSTFKATTYAGGIAGHARGNSIINNCTVSGGTISASASTGYAGGIVGRAESSSVSTCTSNTNISITSGGYVGGIAGKSNSSISGSLITSNITASTSSSTTYAGGVAGESTYSIATCTVKSSNITGYYCGGIAGTFNRASTLTITFDTYDKGYRYQDLSSGSKSTVTRNYDINRVAVRESVTVKGVNVGGLVGILQSGIVANSYTRATISGASRGALKGGLVCEILASGSFMKTGGSGNVGVMIYCYAAVKFTGSGQNFAVTSSSIHTYNPDENQARVHGYVMEYVYDDDTDGNAGASKENVWFFSDNVKAKKSTSDMQKSSTYTGKNFSTTYWNLSSGYPTLKGER